MEESNVYKVAIEALADWPSDYEEIIMESMWRFIQAACKGITLEQAVKVRDLCGQYNKYSYAFEAALGDIIGEPAE